MSIHLKPGDIFFTRGTSFLSRAIRVFTQVIGESRTKVSHTGVIVTEGDLKNAVIVEAVSKVKRQKLWEHYGPPSKSEIAIYRPKNLSEDEIHKITKDAESYVGRKYGALKLIAHLLDWLLQGAYVFRRLACMDKYPICSWVVAYAFEEVRESYFGIEPNAASPDDIWDFIQKHPNEFTEIFLLSFLKDKRSGNAS